MPVLVQLGETPPSDCILQSRESIEEYQVGMSFAGRSGKLHKVHSDKVITVQLKK